MTLTVLNMIMAIMSISVTRTGFSASFTQLACAYVGTDKVLGAFAACWLEMTPNWR